MSLLSVMTVLVIVLCKNKSVSFLVEAFLLRLTDLAHLTLKFKVDQINRKDTLKSRTRNFILCRGNAADS